MKGRDAPVSSSTSTSTTTNLPPPVPRPNLSLIEQRIAVTPLACISSRHFTNTYPLWHPPGARGIFGGTPIAQCIIAATQTVPESLWLHSVHAYFVLAGTADTPIIYKVINIRDGRSYATREIRATQKEAVIFIMIASFQRPSSADRKANGAVAEWGTPMPTDVPPPDQVPSESDASAERQQQIDTLYSTISQRKSQNPNDPKLPCLEKNHAQLVKRHKRHCILGAFECRRLPPARLDYSPSTPISHRKTRHWARTRQLISPEALSETPQFHLAALAYSTDDSFIGTVTRVNPITRLANMGMMVSLDHAIWFHIGPETKVDGEEWLLVEMDAAWAGEERVLVTQRIWRRRDGRLVATCVQEGVVRLKEGSVPKEEKAVGVMRGAGVGDAGGYGKVDSKL